MITQAVVCSLGSKQILDSRAQLSESNLGCYCTVHSWCAPFLSGRAPDYQLPDIQHTLCDQVQFGYAGRNSPKACIGPDILMVDHSSTLHLLEGLSISREDVLLLPRETLGTCFITSQSLLEHASTMLYASLFRFVLQTRLIIWIMIQRKLEFIQPKKLCSLMKWDNKVHLLRYCKMCVDIKLYWLWQYASSHHVTSFQNI